MTDPDEVTELGRATGARGEVVLQRRGSGLDAAVELIVNGAFAMDSRESASERALAELPVTYAGASVLLGGLGLGFSAVALLETAVARIEVVELEEALIAWARAGVTDQLARVAADDRVDLVAGDVAAVLTDAAYGPWDLILLDVDNGPDFLIHADNASLYTDAGLLRAYGQLRAGGTLAIWCQGPHEGLFGALQRLGPTGTHTYTVERGRRRFSYVIYTCGPAPARRSE